MRTRSSQTPNPFYEGGYFANIEVLHLLFVRATLLYRLCLLFALVGNNALAQQPVMQQWSQANGLPSNMVFDIAQDRNGYLWLGHDRGLSRFDGKDVITYTHPKMNGAAVSNVFEDSVGRIWCQNFIGQIFYVLNDSMHLEERLPVSGNYAPMVMDTEGHIVSGFGNEITFYEQKKLDSRHVLPSNLDVTTISMQGGSLWVMTHAKLSEYRGQTLRQSITLQALPQHASYLLGKVGQTMLAMPKANNGGVVYQVLPTMKAIKILPADHVVQTLQVFDDSMVWIGTTGGLYLLDAQLKPLPMQQPLLAGHSISDVMRDRNGAYWVSTTDRGIFRIPDLGIMQWSAPNEVFTVFAHRDNGQGLLVGTESGGVWELNADEAMVQHIPPQAKHRVFTMLRDTKKGLTLMASDKLIGWRNGKQTSVCEGAVKDMIGLKDGRVAVAATGSVFILNGEDANRPTQRVDVGTYVFRSNALAQHGGMVQLASSLGIWQFPEQGAPTANALNKDVIATNLLWVGDTLLAATFGRGILMLHQGKVVDSIAYAAGALTGAASRMVLHAGRVYFRVDRNLYFIDPADWKVQPLNTSILGTNDPITDFIIRNNMMFIASGGRVIRIALSLPIGPSVVPNICIEQVRSNDQPVNHLSPIRLSHQNNSIRITYSIPWFRDQQSLAVQYRLNDGEWRMNEPMSRIIDLPYLSPGKYEVQLRAILADGRYTPTEVVAINIIAPIYARLWFQLLGVLLLGIGFYALYHYRLRFIKGQNVLLQEKMKLEQELDRSMLASIRSQMNPHFIFNALNTIQSYIYLNDKPNAISYLGKFSSLTRLILEMSNHDKVCLRDEVEALKLYLELEKMRFEESLDIEINLDPTIKIDQCFIPPMLIQPYVENAVKHGLLHKKDNRKLRLHFKMEHDHLQVTIEDNGIGRKRSAELNAKGARHRPFSTEANQKRLEIMNKAIPDGFTVTYIDRLDAQGRAEGTSVVLLMPLK